MGMLFGVVIDEFHHDVETQKGTTNKGDMSVDDDHVWDCYDSDWAHCCRRFKSSSIACLLLGSFRRQFLFYFAPSMNNIEEDVSHPQILGSLHCGFSWLKFVRCVLGDGLGEQSYQRGRGRFVLHHQVSRRYLQVSP